MATEIWKEYTFKDGTVAVVKNYNRQELKYAEMRHGELLNIKKVKIKRETNK